MKTTKKSTFVFIRTTEEDGVCDFTTVENPEAKEIKVTISIDGCTDTSASAIADLLRGITYHFDATDENGEEWEDTNEENTESAND